MEKIDSCGSKSDALLICLNTCLPISTPIYFNVTRHNMDALLQSLRAQCIWVCGSTASYWLLSVLVYFYNIINKIIVIIMAVSIQVALAWNFFGHWKDVTAIFLTQTLIYRTLCKKNNNSVGVNPRSVPCNPNTLLLSHLPGSNFRFLTYMGKEKM